MEEIFKPAIYIKPDGTIIDFTGIYEISNYGRRKSLEHIRIKRGFEYLYKEKIKEYTNTNERYFADVFCKDNIKHKCLIQRVVLSTFCPESNTYECVNHKDQNTYNNFVWVNEDGTVDLDKSNLEWCTQKYNLNYSDRNERLSKSMTEHYKNIKKG